MSSVQAVLDLLSSVHGEAGTARVKGLACRRVQLLR